MEGLPIDSILSPRMINHARGGFVANDAKGITWWAEHVGYKSPSSVFLSGE